MSIAASIESLFFASSKALSAQKIAQALNVARADVDAGIAQLMIEYNTGKRGIRILKNGDHYQMATAPEHKKVVQELVREDVHGELTRPQLETLTIIAYRGPMTKSDLEQIRGVHCGLILRNLMMRGLIDATEDATTLQTTYAVSFDFLRWLGVHDVRELPNYTALHGDTRIDDILSIATQVSVEQKQEARVT